MDFELGSRCYGLTLPKNAEILAEPRNPQQKVGYTRWARLVLLRELVQNLCIPSRLWGRSKT